MWKFPLLEILLFSVTSHKTTRRENRISFYRSLIFWGRIAYLYETLHYLSSDRNEINSDCSKTIYLEELVATPLWSFAIYAILKFFVSCETNLHLQTHKKTRNNWKIIYVHRPRRRGAYEPPLFG